MNREIRPNDIDAERGVLGAILLQSENINEVVSLIGFDTRVFYLKENAIIYEAILDLYKATEPIDFVTVHAKAISISKADISIEYLCGMDDITSSLHIKEYCKIIKEKFILREIIRYSNGTINKSGATRIDINKLLEDVGENIRNLCLYNVGAKDYISIEDLSEKSKELIDNPEIVRSHLKYGYNRLDALTYGPKKGEYIILAARPSVGKTTFGLNMAVNMAKQLTYGDGKIYIFSFEMTNEELYRRILASETGIKLNKLRWDNMEKMLTKIDIDRINDSIDHIKRLPIIFDTSFNNNINEIMAKCKKLKHDEGLSAVLIDYLQLIPGNANRLELRQLEVSQISRNLKLMAKDLDVPVIVLSQLSRDIEKRSGKLGKRPRLSDLRDSGSLEQDSDLVMFLHSASIEDESVELIIGKQRNGSVGTIPLIFKREISKFIEEVPEQWQSGNFSE